MKNNQIEAFKVLLGWLKRANKEDILDWKDEDGNTVLHIAASKNQIEVMKLLRKTVKVRAKNIDGKTAMDVLRTQKSPLFTETSRLLRSTKERLFCGSTLTLVDYLMKKRSRIERWSNLMGLSNMNSTGHESINNSDCRGVILVVAILIVTATYQAGLSPPGGFWQEDVMNKNNTTTIHRAGEMIMPVRIALFFLCVQRNCILLISICDPDLHNRTPHVESPLWFHCNSRDW